jgi:hypothetical protein
MAGLALCPTWNGSCWNITTTRMPACAQRQRSLLFSRPVRKGRGSCSCFQGLGAATHERPQPPVPVVDAYDRKPAQAARALSVGKVRSFGAAGIYGGNLRLTRPMVSRTRRINHIIHSEPCDESGAESPHEESRLWETGQRLPETTREGVDVFED